MKTYQQPTSNQWATILKRPIQDIQAMEAPVSEILKRVKSEGDKAVSYYTKKFDGIELGTFLVAPEEIEAAVNALPDELKNAIQTAANNIKTFHAAQSEDPQRIQTMPGVECWRKSVPIQKVGLYIPGGTAPLFSTVLMLGIPAQLAGCREIILCSPPNHEGKIHPAILYAASLIGATKIFKLGGVQAVGAMAYGTASVPKVYKIFGPGNQWVTTAKMLINKEGIAIDMPAGPSEVLVVADETAVPAFVAADLLSQAEHGIDSQVVLLTTSEDFLNDVQNEIQEQLIALPRATIARKALENSVAIVVANAQEAKDIINFYAPEHLIIATANAEEFATAIVNAGSIFLGNYTPESVGDYASGTNHTLPTNGYATAYSGVSLDAFVKKITYQRLSAQGLQNIGKTVELMAAAEELQAHKNAVSIRLAAINKAI